MYNIDNKKEGYRLHLNYKPNLEISIKTTDSIAKCIYNSHINNILTIAKDKINDNREWDNAKKISNDFELIHIPSKKIINDSIAEHIPLSRSYFKMWEILKKFRLVDDFKENIKITSLAEGPGGFIEALVNYRKKMNCVDEINAITLQSNRSEIPGWKKSKNYLIQNKNINLHYGEDGTGDLYNINNILNFSIKTGKHLSSIVTADGGFDFSIDFNKQEQLAYRLIFCEIVTGLCVQKKNGHFVIKIFDIYTKMTLNLLFILNLYYEDVIIYKPDTSRPANSEKYLICKNFKGIKSKELGDLLRIVKNWNIYEDGENIFIQEIIANEIPKYYIDNVLQFNNINANKQLKTIIKTLNLLKKNNEPDKLIKQQIEIAKKWCLEHDISLNNDSKYLLNNKKKIKSMESIASYEKII